MNLSVELSRTVRPRAIEDPKLRYSILDGKGLQEPAWRLGGEDISCVLAQLE